MHRWTTPHVIRKLKAGGVANNPFVIRACEMYHVGYMDVTKDQYRKAKRAVHMEAYSN